MGGFLPLKTPLHSCFKNPVNRKKAVKPHPHKR